MECFQGSYCFRENCVPCRKRVQRYSKFLNYKTFSKVFFEEILILFAIVLNFKYLTQEKIFNILETFLEQRVSREILTGFDERRHVAFFSKIDKKIHKTCYKKKIVLKIALTLHAIYKQKKRDPRGYTE